MVPDIPLRVGISRPVSGIGTSFLLLYLFGFEVLRGSRACSVGVLHFLRFPFSLLSPAYLHGSWSLTVLRIRSNPTEASGSGRTSGESDNLAGVVHQVTPGEPPFPLGRGKGKISEIRYPRSFEYLRAAIQNAKVVGPSRVEHLYGEIFAARYEPPFGV